jgi:hypothetical protein
MALTVVLWRAGRRRRRPPTVAPDRIAPDRIAPDRIAPDRIAPELAEPDLEAVPEPARFPGAAAATNDRFLDVVVLISVILFLLLAAGVGVLVLSSTGLFDQLPFR